MQHTRRFLVTGLLVLAGTLMHGIAPAQSPPPAPLAPPPVGRFQLVVVAGHPGSPFLIDTATGCAWHLLRNEQTKRSTFIEVDVENLHWSWGSGAQHVLAARIEAATLSDEQKRALTQDLQKTGCGLSSVVLMPGMAPQAGGSSRPPK